jgi:ketosteroid isomerase-like protein
MNANEQLIERFYTSFQRRDYPAIAACYHPEAVYSDPVFTDLHGAQIPAMWQMLGQRSADLTISFSEITADEQRGQAQWEARYTFSQTGRPVVNQIRSQFVFQDGLIIRHHDSFNLWKWARMALGQKGVWLGRLPPVQNTIRKQASRALDDFMGQPEQ